MNVLGGQPAPGTQPQTGQPMPGTQVAGAVSGTGQDQPIQAPTAPKQQEGSGMFRDLRKYVQSNVPQAAKMGQAITQNTGEQAKQIGEQVNQQKQQLQQRIQENQGRVNEQQQFGQQQIQKALATTAPVEQKTTTSAATKTPDELAAEAKLQTQNAADLKRFQDITSGTEDYSNVGSLDTSSQQAQAAKLEQLGKLAERTPARRQLLQDTFSKAGSYQGGQKTLDDLILQAGGAIGGIKQGVTAQGKDSLQNIRNAQQAASVDIANLAQAQETGRAGLKTQLTGEQTGLQQTLEQRATKENEDYQALIKGLQTGQLTQQQAGLLGLSSNQLISGNRAAGADQRAAIDELSRLSGGVALNHLTGNLAPDQYNQLLGGIDFGTQLTGPQADAGNIASADEVARAQALAKLSGGYASYLPNIDVGGYEAAKTGRLSDLKSTLKRSESAREASNRQIAQANLYSKYMGDPSKVKNWHDSFGQYIQYEKDPVTGRDKMKLTSAGVDRFGVDETGAGQDTLGLMNRDYQTLQELTDKAYGTRRLQVDPQAVQDGGIIESKQSQARRQALQGMAQRERYIK